MNRLLWRDSVSEIFTRMRNEITQEGSKGSDFALCTLRISADFESRVSRNRRCAGITANMGMGPKRGVVSSWIRPGATEAEVYRSLLKEKIQEGAVPLHSFGLILKQAVVDYVLF